MGFKTGKTVAELGMKNTILDMLDKRIMIIGHPDGDGISDGADITDSGEMINIPNLSSEYPGAAEPINVPMANVDKGVIAGTSVFLEDTEGKEVQISFLSAQAVNLEAMVKKEHPLGFDDACEDMEGAEEGELQFYKAEVGLFDMEDDPHTPYTSHDVVVAAENATEARQLCEEYAQDNIPVTGNIHFYVMGDVERYEP